MYMWSTICDIFSDIDSKPEEQQEKEEKKDE